MLIKHSGQDGNNKLSTPKGLTITYKFFSKNHVIIDSIA